MNVMENLQARAVEHQSAAAAIRAKASAESRELTDAERAVLNSHLAEFDAAKADIEIQNRLENAENWLAQPAGRKIQPDGLQNTRLQTAGEKGRWGFNSLGDYAKSVRNSIVNPSNMDPRLIQNATLSTYGTEGTGADGGFAVPPEYRADIEALVLGEQSLLSRCDSSPTTSNRVVVTTDESTAWQSSGGVLTYWGSEAGSMTQSKPALKEINVPLHKLYALVPVTDELLEDAPMLGNFLAAKAGEKIDFAVTNAIVNGTGVGQPLGIMNAACTVSVAKESSQAADTIVARNLLKMATRMPANAFANAVWLCNQDTIQEIWQANLTFKDAVGSAGIAAGTRMPTISLPGENGQTFSTIMGRPVIVTEACDTLGDTGDLILANLKGYFAPYKAGGLRSDLSMHLWFDQGIQAFRWTFRVGGQPWLSAAITPLNSSNTLSHFVKLDAR
jgi:HK97 family phage major capsid protein